VAVRISHSSARADLALEVRSCWMKAGTLA
jgi:hypothetical protein